MGPWQTLGLVTLGVGDYKGIILDKGRVFRGPADIVTAKAIIFVLHK